MKNQIIKHSEHQFLEGDVEHWWHEETGRGIRTRFSDDLLWLPYMVIKYIRHTGNYEILNVVTPYLSGAQLQENEKEKYEVIKELVNHNGNKKTNSKKTWYIKKTN